MKYLYSLILLCFAMPSFAQSIQEHKNNRASEKIVTLFNARFSDSLYAITDQKFKKNVNYRTFEEVLIKHLYPLGKINKKVFQKFESGISRYKAELDSGNLTMMIMADVNGDLVTYGFQPYKPEFSDTLPITKSDNLKRTPLDKKVDSIIQRLMFASKTVGLSVGILTQGKSYYYHYGAIRKGSDTLPNNSSIYEIGSITKTLTGLLLANAVVGKRMNLQDPVNTYLPKEIPMLQLDNDTLKVVHLSNHTSGLPRIPLSIILSDQSNPYKFYDNDQLYSYLKNAKLFSRPGEQSSYSNLGVGLLGALLENVYGMPFEALVHKFITNIAGMYNTVQILNSTNKNLLLQGYNKNGYEQGPWDFMVLAGAGALRSNIKDMLEYARYNLGIQVHDKKQQAILKISQTKTYDKNNIQIALGWFMRTSPSNSLYFHDGQTGGYKSFLIFDSRTQNAVVLLSNTAVSHDEEGFKLMQFLDNR